MLHAHDTRVLNTHNSCVINGHQFHVAPTRQGPQMVQVMMDKDHKPTVFLQGASKMAGNIAKHLQIVEGLLQTGMLASAYNPS